MILKNGEGFILLCIAICLATKSCAFRTSHRRFHSSGPLIFPRDDPHSCITPVRHPGMCVPIERCPQIRLVGLRRLPKYVCGFDKDTPLVCCEATLISPSAGFTGLPELLPGSYEKFRPELVQSHTHHNPIPIVCTHSVREGRRWKSCWYLTLQRVDFPAEEPQSPADKTGPASTPKPSPAAASSPAPTVVPTTASPATPSSALRPPGRPNKTSVVSL